MFVAYGYAVVLLDFITRAPACRGVTYRVSHTTIYRKVARLSASASVAPQCSILCASRAFW
ncbi:hypothetical protein BPSOL_0391 [Bifidobacterium pseudolongum]|nr:hypothetical protein BPSOL_0391 [Bifidobacterium pseudolongum]